MLWPFKLIVPLASLLLVQRVSETIEYLWAARTGIELEHKERIEIRGNDNRARDREEAAPR